MLICCNRGQFFVISFHRGQNYLLLIGRAAKILAADWMSTTVLHFVGFCILCKKKKEKNKFFEVLSKFDSLSRVLCTKNRWKSSAAARKKIPKG